MKRNINLFFGIILTLIFNNGFCQIEMNLKGDFYPEKGLNESGCRVVDFNINPFESYNYIHIKGLENFLIIDSLNAEVVELNLLFTIGKLDTVLSVKNSVDSISYKKNFIPEFVIRPRFKDLSTAEIIEERFLYFCAREQHKYRIKIEFISNKKLKYQLYYFDNCDSLNRKSPIRYGVITLRKRKPSKYINLYQDCDWER